MNERYESELPEFEDIDLFAEGVEERLNAGTTSCIASGTSISSSCTCFCSFSTIGCACTGGAIEAPAEIASAI